MKKFAMRSDMEGLFGVVSWDEVIPGRAQYPSAVRRLHLEVNALARGLLDAGADTVEIYDEHYYGLNIDVSRMAPGVSVIRGKPPYRTDWPGGLDEGVSGLVLQGYHAMAGTTNAILPHTYEPDINAIWINGTLVGEIGVEAAIAGEANVPLVLFVGDLHGAREAEALVSGVECVVVKEGRGEEKGLCRSWRDISADLVAASRKVIQAPSPCRPLVFDPPIEMLIQLNDGPYRDRLAENHPHLFRKKDMAAINGKSVLAVWADYWAIKDEVLAGLS